ncbi:MAG: amidase [Proteobacteria bacterium]|nr:amidase [Pseudomonadota bacterium]
MIDFAALRVANAPLAAFVDWDERAAFGKGPLAGLTVGVKANIAVAGLPWTGGLEAHRNRVAERDADVVARLRRAGAAITGSLNMEEAALGAATRNPFYGWTHNPHALDHTPGGSSGGSGAAVAAGLCDIALGTDTMGSVRIPAAYCGVYGFKPANQRVSQAGLEVAEASLDCIGPLARSIDVLERAATVMSDLGDGATGGIVTLAGLGGVACDPGVSAAYRRALDALRPSAEIALHRPLSRVRFAGFVKTAKALAAHLAPHDATLSPGLRTLLDYGVNRRAEDWTADQTILDDVAATLSSAMAGGAILLLPTAPQAAFADDLPAPPNQADFTCLANIAGLAALSIPAGADTGGMPVAVQLVAEGGREAGLFAAARRLDAALAAYRRPPNFVEGTRV